MRDMIGTPVDVGDWLIDERGRTFEVRYTDRTVQQYAIYTYVVTMRKGQIYLGDEGFLREGFCLKVDIILLTAPLDERIAVYTQAFHQYREPQLRAEYYARRAEISAARAKRLTGANL